MEFRLLGPVEVLVDGDLVPLGGRQRRLVLALLLTNADQPVPTERIIDELWGEAPPEAARKTVQSHIAHLRRSLNAEREVIKAVDSGYVLTVGPDLLDSRRFEDLVEEARSLRTVDPGRSTELLTEGLGLFRGAPLSGMADDAFTLRVEASRLEELRLAAMEEILEARLERGDEVLVIAELERIVAEHPLRERVWGLLMVAQYRAGRQGDALRSFSRARQTLAEELGVEPSLELRALEQRIMDQDPTLIDATPVKAPSTPPPVAVPVRNPYKGLRAFDEVDEGDFFGRDELVRRLLERVDGRQGSLTILAGPSGAGKSSVVRAGLVPELRRRGATVAVMFPGADPFPALASAVAEESGSDAEVVLARLDAGRPASGAAMVVVVDQLEEAFGLPEADLADRFLRLFAGHGPVRWVVTIRADFLDRLLSHPALGRLIEEALVLVPPLGEHEVAAAVANPAARVGVPVDDDLVGEIVRDVATRPAALPLLQYALTDMFERRRGDRLDRDTYERSGGISGALSRRAEELFESMDAEGKETVRRLLLSLVTVSEEGEVVRRRVTRSSLASLPVPESELDTVLERLGAQRLLTFDQDPVTGEATVEVAHEALFSEWPRLTRWVDDNVEDIRLRQRLDAAAGEWVESEQDEGFLLTGSRLDQMSAWASSTDLPLAPVEQEFLEESRAVRDAQTHKAGRTRRLIAGGVAVAVVGAAGLGLFAWTQQRAAAEQERIVRVGDLAAAANANLDIDPERSMLLALEAVETTRDADGSVLTVAEQALHNALMTARPFVRISHAGQGIAHFSADGQLFVTSGEDPTTARIWETERPDQPLLTLVGHAAPVIDAVFDPTGARVATASVDGTVRVWDATNGEVAHELATDGAPLFVPVFSNDGSKVAATSPLGTAWVWDLATGEAITPESPEGTEFLLNLAFSPDDRLIGLTRPNTSDPRPFLLDVASGALAGFLEHLEATDIGFTPDGALIMTSGADAIVKAWDAETLEEVDAFLGHEGPVTDLEISADGNLVASCGRTDCLLWDLASMQTVAEVVGHIGEVDGVDLSPPGDHLLTASRIDGSARLWDLSPWGNHELVGLPGPQGWPGAVDYGPDGTVLGASHGDGSVTFWDAATRDEIVSLDEVGEARRMELDSGGNLLAVAGSNGVRLHDLDGGETRILVEDVDGHDVSFSEQGLLAVATPAGAFLWEAPYQGDGDSLSSEWIYDLAFSPGGETIALSVDDDDAGIVEIRGTEGNQLVATLSEHSRPSFGLAFSRDGRHLATASEDSTAIIWDTATFQPLHRLEGHTAPLNDVEFAPDRGEVATASLDGTIRIWDVETGVVRLTLPGAGGFTDLDYSPEGRYLAASSPEGFVTVYLLDVNELVEEAGDRLTRGWTEAECAQYLEVEVCPPA